MTERHALVSVGAKLEEHERGVRVFGPESIGQYICAKPRINDVP